MCAEMTPHQRVQEVAKHFQISLGPANKMRLKLDLVDEAREFRALGSISGQM